jgi:hypothetical protein
MFFPITVGIQEGTRVVGVKFKSCDFIKNLITRYSTSFNKEVTIWGSFSFHVPCTTTLYRPSSYSLEPSDKFPSHSKITVFVPLGILNEAILNYSLGREFIQQCDNTPSLIELNGIFAKIPTSNLSVNNSNVSLLNKNPFESVEKGLTVRYFTAGTIDLTTNIVKPVSFSSQRNNCFTLDQKPREFLDSLKNPDDFKWWAPTEVWRKRDFEVLEVDLENDIVSGLNYSSKDMDVDNNAKLFYGKSISTDSPAIRSLRLKLLDGKVTPNTIYYIKAKININYSGFTSSNIESLSESEKNNIRIGDSKYTSDLKMAPVKVCREIYIPVAWYDINELEIDNPNYDKCSTNASLSAAVILSDTIEYAHFIERSFKGNETITLAPLGLMTEVINEKQVSNINILLNVSSVARYVSQSEWNYNSWNRYFIENLQVIDVVEKIPEDYYKLFNKYVVLADSKINTGANLEFIYNSSELEWDVLKNFSYFITNYINKDLIFDIPDDLKDIYTWNANIRNIYLNRYVLDKSLYTVGEDGITISSNDIITKLTGGHLIGRFNFDFFFDKEKMFETVKDDFNLTRQINWIPYEANSKEIFENLKRIPSKKLLFGDTVSTDTSTQQIIKVDNQYAFKSLNNNSIYPFEGRQNGTRINNRNISISQNEPNSRRIYMIDNDNFIFDISAEVYFDSALNTIKNYKGKKFEIVLKASETFDPILGKNILNSYYYAGIGSFDFDVALGVSQFNKDTLKNESSFLAGFGDYNTKNIKSNTWYKIRCIVTNDYIRVLFNPKDEPERLVLNYFINEKYQTDTSRYLSGNFEELVYNISGLDTLNIIYPDKVEENTNSDFTRKFLNTDLIPKVRPFGSLCGFRIFNEYTYMTNVQYKYLSEDGYQIGNAFDTENLTKFIKDIKSKY